MVYHFDFNHTLTDKVSSTTLVANQSVDYTKDHFLMECGGLRFEHNTALEWKDSRFSSKVKKEFTIAVWAKANAPEEWDDLIWFTIFCKGKQGKEGINSPQLRFQVTSETVSLSTDNTWKKTNLFLPDVWYHLVVSCKGNKVEFYVNGRENAQFELKKGWISNNDPLYIGKDVPGNLEYFDGVIDDFRMYNKALSPSDVLSLFNEPMMKGVNFCHPTTPLVSQVQVQQTVIVPKIDTVYQKITITKIDTVHIYQTDSIYNKLSEQSGAHFVLEHLEFYQSLPDWKPSSLPTLNKLLDYLIKNPTIKIQLEGHTDNRGDKSENQKLSKLRVNNVKRWLCQKGVEKERISTVGFGDRRPIASNTTEEGKRKNRRVEVKIL
ncbi:hypothetical protein AVL50_31025 [Flammeovirga sp. SJP92]|nr:hypothetical protein AVL50_31025 [Flammeovirga sp. SJP92]